MKELQQGGKLWGLPRDISTLVMYYNAFLNSRPPADNAPFVRGVEYAEPEMALFTANFGGVSTAYQTAIDRILADRATPAEAASQACDAANPLFKQ